MKKSSLVATCVLSFALVSAGNAQGTTSAADTGVHLSRSQLKQLTSDAHTPEQYNTLAAYYGAKQATYLRKAEDERLEWVRRSQNIVLIEAKYPRPVDSAKYLYEYYLTEATDAGALAAKYANLAALVPGAPVK